MFEKMKKILKKKRGAVNTIEILGWVAVGSVLLAVVVASLKPAVIGDNSIMTNSINRIEDLDKVMKP